MAVALLSLTAAVITSCGHADEPAAQEKRQIVFLFSPGGLGDMGYNDCILRGVQRFRTENPGVDIYIHSPASLPEAEKIFSDWLRRPASDIPVLFALGSSDYEAMTETHLAGIDLTPNKSILLFESRKHYDEENIHTFQISMYGASYLAGVTARRCADSGGKDALIVLANDTDSPIGVAAAGFTAGYGAECRVEYLAHDWTGYVSAPLAYRRMSEWAGLYSYIFPVAGGSNSGIYRYSREFADSPLLAGMDIDQSPLSNKITGSVIKHIDRLIYEYLTEWTLTGRMPENSLYGLESGYADWQLSDGYTAEFGAPVAEKRPEAIRKETEYYEATH